MRTYDYIDALNATKNLARAFDIEIEGEKWRPDTFWRGIVRFWMYSPYAGVCNIVFVGPISPYTF